jgi:hypothetical protein
VLKVVSNEATIAHGELDDLLVLVGALADGLEGLLDVELLARLVGDLGARLHVEAGVDRGAVEPRRDVLAEEGAGLLGVEAPDERDVDLAAPGAGRLLEAAEQRAVVTHRARGLQGGIDVDGDAEIAERGLDPLRLVAQPHAATEGGVAARGEPGLGRVVLRRDALVDGEAADEG